MTSYAKVYPEESFFIVPGKGSVPVWKQMELKKDPSFKDLKEQVEEANRKGSGSTWSATHGYDTTFRQEAAVLKANTRKMREEQEKTIKMIKQTKIPTEPEACCVIM